MKASLSRWPRRLHNMSIINDALKKTQENLDKEKKEEVDISKIYEKMHQKVAAATGQAKKDAKASTMTSSWAPGLIFVFLALLGIAYLQYPKFFKSTFRKIKTAAIFKLGPAAKPQPHASYTPSAPSTQAKNTAHSTLTLNGIIATEGRKAALINNRIYEINDTVGEKKLINITPNWVELQDGENILTLRVGEKN